MRFLGDIRRDMRFGRQGERTLFGTTQRQLTESPFPRHSPLVHADLARLAIWSGPTINAGRHRAAGVIMLGPDERAPDMVPYRITGRFGVTNTAIQLVAFYAIADASPQDLAAGQGVNWAQFIDISVGGQLAIDELFAIEPFGTIESMDFSARALVFGIAAINPTAANVTPVVAGQMSIQRLVGPPPRFVDRRVG